jgi:dihydrofolate reductase
MKKICYVVAMSLDGYIAGPNGEADWIPMDPDMDFTELWSRFDILLMGRKTYEMTRTVSSSSARRNRKSLSLPILYEGRMLPTLR